MRYGTAKKGAKQRAARNNFARRNGNCDWRSVIFTDSKIFCLHMTGAKLWYPKRRRPVKHLPKNTPTFHVHYGGT